MKCKFCGCKIGIGGRFCPNCCAPVEYSEEDQEKFEKLRLLKIEEKQKKVTKNNFELLISFIIFIIILGVPIYFFVLRI